jgi:hypothetical protein
MFTQQALRPELPLPFLLYRFHPQRLLLQLVLRYQELVDFRPGGPVGSSTLTATPLGMPYSSIFFAYVSLLIVHSVPC